MGKVTFAGVAELARMMVKIYSKCLQEGGTMACPNSNEVGIRQIILQAWGSMGKLLLELSVTQYKDIGHTFWQPYILCVYFFNSGTAEQFSSL